MDDDTCVETCQKIDRLEEMNVKLKQVKGLPSVRIAKGNPNKIMHDSNRVIIPPICVRSYANIYPNFSSLFLDNKEKAEGKIAMFLFIIPEGAIKENHCMLIIILFRTHMLVCYK